MKTTRSIMLACRVMTLGLAFRASIPATRCSFDKYSKVANFVAKSSAAAVPMDSSNAHFPDTLNIVFVVVVENDYHWLLT